MLVELGFEPTLWLAEPGWAMFWAIFVSIWAHLGFYTLILLAGLQAIPRDLYEAAEMDGTRPLRASSGASPCRCSGRTCSSCSCWR